MSENTTITEPTQPVVEQTPPVEEKKEFRYTYQPKDENGNNLGAPQVIKATSPEEALDKMAEQNAKLIKLNRKLNKDIRLGKFVEETIPEDARRFDAGKFELTPEPLTAEERIQLVQDMNDPEKFDAGSARLIRSQIGDPEALRNRITRLEESNMRYMVQQEALAFMRSTPSYYACEENKETLCAWIIKNNLDPIKENFQLAFETLGPGGAGVLTQRPEPQSEPVAPVAPVVETHPVETAPIVEAPAPQKKPGAFGLTRNNSSDQGPAPAPQGFSKEDIDRMSADEYKQKILIPEWKKARQQPQTA